MALLEETRFETLEEAAGEAVGCKSCAGMFHLEKGLSGRNRIVEEYVRAERDQSVKEARRWCMVVRETKRKIELERILQKETFRRCKLEMKGELEKQLEAGEGREA